MPCRKTVKGQIAEDLWQGARKVGKVVSSLVHAQPEKAPGATSPVAHSTTCERIVNNGTSASKSDDLRSGLSMETERPADHSSVVTEAQSKSLATVDECLNALPSARRKNPTAAILPKVDMKFALEFKGSVLYEKQKGYWVVELLPEKPAKSVAPATTQILGA